MNLGIMLKYSVSIVTFQLRQINDFTKGDDRKKA